MPKTGAERKARRRARQAEEAARASQQAPGGASDVGSVKASPLQPGSREDLQEAYDQAEADLIAAGGEHWAAGGNEVVERANQRLVRRSLRWLTDGDGASFDGRSTKELQHKELALLQTRRAMLSKDLQTAVGLGVGTLIKLERQNQVDELNYDPFLQPRAPGTSDAAPSVNIVMNFPENGRGPVIG